MLFSSLTFLSIFLPVVVLLYYCCKPSLRNYVLLIASLVFYAWGEPKYIAVMLFVILYTYCIGMALYHSSRKKTILFIGVIGIVSILFYFKYANFVIDNINKSSLFTFNSIDVLMPVGISFFIFQALSYIIDIYKKGKEDINLQPEKDIYSLALYISLFPQLIAGPIIKYHDIYKEIHHRTERLDLFIKGLLRFSFGLGKKVLIANTLGKVADAIFSSPIDEISMPVAWLGAICYSLQLYFDFSGYSDMAIGLGRMFGFTFPENFNYPYIANSITDFWRRWHIALGTWFREYLYIPLGGNRVSTIRMYTNIFIVFLATGLWHGASWTFIIWGIWHGLFVILERMLRVELYTNLIAMILRHSYTLLVFIIGWVLFRADTLQYGFRFIRIMLGLKHNKATGYNIWYYIDGSLVLALIIAILASTGIFKHILIEKKENIIAMLFSIIVTMVSMLVICSSTYNPFIYFRF